MPLDYGFISIEEGQVSISSIKMEEDKPGSMIIRVYESDGMDQNIVFRLHKAPVTACFTDINENPCDGNVTIKGFDISFKIRAYSVETISLGF